MLQMDLLFQINARQLFRPFGYYVTHQWYPVLHDTFFFCMLYVAKSF